ncbi:LIP-domain-containing protein [Thozetella sp. PMI_491]|nr:LIP-domain-containing protein [Thozetella sp. PMI_491]
MRAERWTLLLWSIILVQAQAVDVLYPGDVGAILSALGPLTYNAPPSQDKWYQPPDGWEKAARGSVLRVRANAYRTIRIQNAHDVFQVLFRSSDTHGNPSWAVSTVFIPISHVACLNGTNTTACAHGIVSYQIPTDSVDIDAAPSFLLQLREPYGDMRDLLAKGWFVAVPDYEGPRASFCAGMQAGYATLDGAKAVLQAAGQFGLQTERARIALWGYSGGAFATEFAIELASSYAPDLKLAGAVVGGPSPNLTTVDELMNKKPTTGLVVASVVGITVQQPRARAFLESRLKETGLMYNATTFLSVQKMSGVDALTFFANQDIYDYFKNRSADLWDPIMQDVIDRDAVMNRHGVPNMPVFFYKAIADEMSPVKETDDIVESYCARGANILYHRNTIGGHNDELWSGRNRTVKYLEDVLDDKKSPEILRPATGCATYNVSVDLEDFMWLLPDWWWTTGWSTHRPDVLARRALLSPARLRT